MGNGRSETAGRGEHPTCARLDDVVRAVVWMCHHVTNGRQQPQHLGSPLFSVGSVQRVGIIPIVSIDGTVLIRKGGIDGSVVIGVTHVRQAVVHGPRIHVFVAVGLTGFVHPPQFSILGGPSNAGGVGIHVLRQADQRPVGPKIRIHVHLITP